MFTVLYDHQKFTTQRYGGISRYFANLIHEISASQEMSYQLGVLQSDNHYIKDIRLPGLNPAARFLAGKRSSFLYRFNEKYSAKLVEKNAFDIFHPTYYDTYFFDKIKKPFVTTIHDMTYELLPEYFWAHDDLPYKKRLHIERADHIIAISETTKADLLACSKADPTKISVIHHGIDLEENITGTKVNGLPEQYLLFVGDRSGYKNFYTFMKAFKQVSQRHPDLHVVLSGGGNVAIADREFIARLGIQDKAHHYHVSDSELHYLYENATAFVYPSLYEGFGYPILEAYRASCPVVLSRIPCFAEVAGDAALFFEPSSVEDLAAVIEKMLGDSSLRNELVAKGRKRLLDFPLRDSIRKTLDLYKTLA